MMQLPLCEATKTKKFQEKRTTRKELTVFSLLRYQDVFGGPLFWGQVHGQLHWQRIPIPRH